MLTGKCSVTIRLSMVYQLMTHNALHATFSSHGYACTKLLSCSLQKSKAGFTSLSLRWHTHGPTIVNANCTQNHKLQSDCYTTFTRFVPSDVPKIFRVLSKTVTSSNCEKNLWKINALSTHFHSFLLCFLHIHLQKLFLAWHCILIFFFFSNYIFFPLWLLLWYSTNYFKLTQP